MVNENTREPPPPSGRARSGTAEPPRPHEPAAADRARRGAHARHATGNAAPSSAPRAAGGGVQLQRARDDLAVGHGHGHRARWYSTSCPTRRGGARAAAAAVRRAAGERRAAAPPPAARSARARSAAAGCHHGRRADRTEEPLGSPYPTLPPHVRERKERVARRAARQTMAAHGRAPRQRAVARDREALTRAATTAGPTAAGRAAPASTMNASSRGARARACCETRARGVCRARARTSGEIVAARAHPVRKGADPPAVVRLKNDDGYAHASQFDVAFAPDRPPDALASKTVRDQGSAALHFGLYPAVSTVSQPCRVSRRRDREHDASPCWRGLVVASLCCRALPVTTTFDSYRAVFIWSPGHAGTVTLAMALRGAEIPGVLVDFEQTPNHSPLSPCKPRAVQPGPGCARALTAGPGRHEAWIVRRSNARPLLLRARGAPTRRQAGVLPACSSLGAARARAVRASRVRHGLEPEPPRPVGTVRALPGVARREAAPRPARIPRTALSLFQKTL